MTDAVEKARDELGEGRYGRFPTSLLAAAAFAGAGMLTHAIAVGSDEQTDHALRVDRRRPMSL